MMKCMIVGMLLAMGLAGPAATQPAAEDKPVSIVLVHGAFVDASGWKLVHDFLLQDGYEVLMVQNPTVTLAGDVEATRQVIARARHPVVLVGHSYGGAVITQAGGDPKVRSLVYIAAFMPDVGETVFELATRPSPGEASAPLLPPEGGFLLVDRDQFPAAFAADVDASLTQFMATAQVPWGLDAVQAESTFAAWRIKPSMFMLTTQDLMVAPSTQRWMAMRADAELVEIASSHAVMLSHPRDVASLIVSAAAKVKQAGE